MILPFTTSDIADAGVRTTDNTPGADVREAHEAEK